MLRNWTKKSLANLKTAAGNHFGVRVPGPPLRGLAAGHCSWPDHESFCGERDRQCSSERSPCWALVVACNSSSAPRLTGTNNYDLVPIAGHALPAASGSNLVVRGGATLDACGRFVLSEVDTLASSASATVQAVDGSWTMKGDSVRLTTRVSQASYSGTLIASELTLVPVASPIEIRVYHRH